MPAAHHISAPGLRYRLPACQYAADEQYEARQHSPNNAYSTSNGTRHMPTPAGLLLLTWMAAHSSPISRKKMSLASRLRSFSTTLAAGTCGNTGKLSDRPAVRQKMGGCDCTDGHYAASPVCRP